MSPPSQLTLWAAALVALASVAGGAPSGGAEGAFAADSEVLSPDETAPFASDAAERPVSQDDGDVVPSHPASAAYRNAGSRSSRWPGGVVPYEMDKGISGSPAHKAALEGAIRDYARYTCIDIRPRRREKDYVKFFRGDGCYSNLGRQGGKQDISLGWGCQWKGTAIHEIMHALGFDHEQNRPDRDRFVDILEPNIQRGLEPQFYKMRYQTELGVPYDFKSVMHYGNNYFAKQQGQHTIEVSKNLKLSESKRLNMTKFLGQRMGFSTYDVKEINKFYDCPPKNDPTPAAAVDKATKKPTTIAPVVPSNKAPKAPGTTSSPGGGGSEAGSGGKACVDEPILMEVRNRAGSVVRTYRSETYCPAVAKAGHCDGDMGGFKRCNATCANCGPDAKRWRDEPVCEDSRPSEYCGKYLKYCRLTVKMSYLKYHSDCRRSCGFCGDKPPLRVKDCLRLDGDTELRACVQLYSTRHPDA